MNTLLKVIVGAVLVSAAVGCVEQQAVDEKKPAKVKVIIDEDSQNNTKGDDPNGAAGCLAGQRDVDGSCVPADQLTVFASTMVMDGVTSQQLHICTNSAVRDVAIDENDVLAESEDCRVVGQNGMYRSTHEGAPLDAGDVTISGAGVGGVKFVPDADGNACYRPERELPTNDLFEPGSSLHVASTGGEHFPAFEFDLATASLTGVEVPAITPGNSATIRWERGDADEMYVLVIATGADGTYNISCATDDDGAITIPESLTAAVEGADSFQVFLTRSANTHLEPAEASVVIDGFATHQMGFSQFN